MRGWSNAQQTKGPESSIRKILLDKLFDLASRLQDANAADIQNLSINWRNLTSLWIGDSHVVILRFDSSALSSVLNDYAKK
ncbi:hypothetical protein WK78_00655 [Burkholderia cepacia]|nr:hypothetical protein WK78_00655 [Burkholderia cepacia]